MIQRKHKKRNAHTLAAQYASGIGRTATATACATIEQRGAIKPKRNRKLKGAAARRARKGL